MKIANVDVKDLKEKYGTPLYIFDQEKIEANMLAYKNNLVSNEFETEVLFASKAFNVKEIIRIAKTLDISLDVVSLGELYTAIKVDFPMNHVYFHGNNKSTLELTYCLNYGVGEIVVDNLDELKELDKLTKELKKEAHILIRLNVGISAHTHKYIMTAYVDSKFGVLYDSVDFKQMQEIINNSKYIKLDGFHSHIGSQIFDLEAFSSAAKKMASYLKDYNYPMILNLGGGFGVRYTKDDSPIPFDIVSKTLINSVESVLHDENIKLKKLAIEPGRSIVGEAGYTLYTVGYTKKTPNKEYYFIDGGMTDNIRPALYQAKYDADIIGKENEPKNTIVTIAGKCCESGDLIIEDYPIQKASSGDLLITYTTGAYGYSMSSNYNKALTPAVVFVKNGQSKLVVRRMTLDELIEREE